MVESGGGVYWFDAGEGCSRTAHLLGIDLLAVRAIFISHTHMDHIGGLPNLLWDMRKVNSRADDPARRLNGKHVRVFMPNMSVWRERYQQLSQQLRDKNIDPRLPWLGNRELIVQFK